MFFRLFGIGFWRGKATWGVILPRRIVRGCPPDLEGTILVSDRLHTLVGMAARSVVGKEVKGYVFPG